MFELRHKLRRGQGWSAWRRTEKTWFIRIIIKYDHGNYILSCTYMIMVNLSYIIMINHKYDQWSWWPPMNKPKWRKVHCKSCLWISHKCQTNRLLQFSMLFFSIQWRYRPQLLPHCMDWVKIVKLLCVANRNQAWQPSETFCTLTKHPNTHLGQKLPTLPTQEPPQKRFSFRKCDERGWKSTLSTLPRKRKS